MSVSVGVIEVRYLDVPKFPVEPFVRELKLGPISTYGCLRREFDPYDLGFQSESELHAAMRPGEVNPHYLGPADEWGEVYEDDDEDWHDFDFEWWGGNWDSNGMYEFPRDGLEQMGMVWAFKRRLSPADRAFLLDWIANLPFEDDVILLHIGE